MKCAFSILRSFNVRVESVEDCFGNVSTLRETRYALEIYSSFFQLFPAKVLLSSSLILLHLQSFFQRVKFLSV